MKQPFDEAKYKALLEGLEISILLKSELENFGDLSSEYFLSEFIRMSTEIRKLKYLPLGDISYITDGEHGSPDWDDNSIIKYITAEFIKPNYIQNGNFKTISEKQDRRNTRAHLKENDVLIYSVGAYAGYSAKAEKHLFPANIPRSVAIVRPNELLSSEYLSVFLNSKYGEFQTKRFRAGNSQPVLALEKIKQFEIPILTDAFQSNIKVIYNQAYAYRLLSLQTYTQAENLLLDTLDLKDFQVFHEPVNVKNFSESFGSSGRLDAEYYQIKYEQVVERIKSTNYDRLVDIVKIKKSIEPGSVHYSEVGLPFIRVSDYNKFGLSTPDKYLTDEFCKENAELIKGLKPKKETILFSKDGSVGTAYMLRKDADFITSGAILHLTIKDKTKIIPEYLTLALNSKLVQMQAERDAGGSIILHWRVSEIENVIVPIIALDKQLEIAELVEESFKLKKQSEHLLEVAKKAVEMAIEINEKSAIEYIERSTKIAEIS
ncbi:MAG: restriction endonuclease subunit S [Candidatus Kapabacteria bacterium]|nr:restriction endonuclease subunit S [Candidatus Kapabacteria bacterium]